MAESSTTSSAPRAGARTLVATLAAALAVTACGESEPPNIVLVVVDTLRADVMQSAVRAGEGLDRLAQEGVVFPHAFSHAPMTLPSHTALFSARPPFRTGVFNNWQEVPEELPLFAEWLQGAGYQTRAVISLGTLDARDQKPSLKRGFDVYDLDYWHMDLAPSAVERMRTSLDGLTDEAPFFLFAHFSDPHEPYNDHEGTETAEILVDGEPLTTATTSVMSQGDHPFTLEPGRHVVEIRSPDLFRLRDMAWFTERGRIEVTFEEGQRLKPTNLVRAVVDLEQPIEADLRYWLAEAYPPKEIQRRYRGEVAWMQPHLGALFAELERRGLWENTILVFTSDHGEALGERKVYGHVQNLYDEMLHVPMLIKPVDDDDRRALTAAQKRPFVHQDLVPTLLDMAGLPPLPGALGRSVLDGGTSPLIAQTHRPEAKRDSLCMRDERYKLIFWPDTGEFAMYDLERDPGELEDAFATLRQERPDWPEQLRGLADLSAAQQGEGEVTDEVRGMLEALGYAGGDEDVGGPSD